MRRLVVLVLLAVLCACADEKPKPLSEPGEKLYVMRGVIVSRDVPGNSVTVNHEAIPGFMEAMQMDYSVRGADVASLPPDKSRIEAKLHVTDRGYWITDVKSRP
jgi:protein SCO1/2